MVGSWANIAKLVLPVIFSRLLLKSVGGGGRVCVCGTIDSELSQSNQRSLLNRT